MNTLDPFNLFHLAGSGEMRNVTLALPIDAVRRLLPVGLLLGPQNITPPWTHPVILGFHTMHNLHTSVPSLLPPYSYFEHSVGIPHCYVSDPMLAPGSAGPYYFMPKLLVDNAWVALGGRLFWGFNNQLAAIQTSENGFAICQANGSPIVSLWHKAVQEPRAPLSVPEFTPQGEAISQCLISLAPAGAGPLFLVAEFPKFWPQARLQPLETVVEIHSEYVPGLVPGRYPTDGRNYGIDQSIAGSYTLQAQFQVGCPCPPICNLG